MYFDCNCCARHQHNKAFIENDNLQIITKNNTFDPNYKWEGSYKSNYNPDYCGCPCICRKLSRNMARDWLTKKYGRKAVEGDKFYLGIKLSEFTIEDIEYDKKYKNVIYAIHLGGEFLFKKKIENLIISYVYFK